ncbi:MAG: alpha-1,4-glucan--maltose-1-phosphate maltosyltransferase [Vicinamibacterales bacterium]
MPRSGRRRSTTNGTAGARHDRAAADGRHTAVAAQGLDAAASQPPGPHLALRVVIEQVSPAVDGGRFPAKRVEGDRVAVHADVFADGHDVLAVVLRDRPGPAAAPSGQTSADAASAPGWRETRMSLTAPGTDRWTASFVAGPPGWHDFTIVAWVDRFATWQRDLRVRVAAGQDIGLELQEGALLVHEAGARAAQAGDASADAWWFDAHATLLADDTAVLDERVDLALSAPLAEAMFSYADRRHATAHPPCRVWVDRERARTGAWYEMFPRSAGTDPSRSATFAEAATRLEDIAGLGFDVLYLPPIHPIGRSFRKGPNNSLEAGPDAPGSPWAIGSEAGGHTAVEPGLGTLDDFDAFHAEARRVGLELALDLAWQCSPDHPWVTEHPEWFRHRPDASIRYAENPPKKYQDIYPLDFACQDWPSLWTALLEVTRFWLRRGVRIFRVDNPHTKSFGFWEWLIAEIHREDPGAIFLAEAFTRPAVMRYLAKAGFTQSYTYFTWRNTKAELEDYFTELTAGPMRDYFRPNVFANTPDILHEYLQHGGRPAFEARLVLAATLAATYGIYSGFELIEHDAVRPGSEEYLDSEKYQVRVRDWTAPGNIRDLVRTLNTIRRVHPALQSNDTLRFCRTDNDQLIAYTKVSADGSDVVLTVVNLDPHHMQHGHVEVPLALIAAGDQDAFTAHDLLTGTTFTWRGARNYVRLDPGLRQAHVMQLTAHRAG